VIRGLGTDRKLALALLDELAAELGKDENPRIVDFLVETFLPSQRGLKSYGYSEKCVGWLLRFLNSKAPNLRLSDVNRQHVEHLARYYTDLAPNTCNGSTQKFKQGLNVAVDVGLLSANPIARMKQLLVDNRRLQFLALTDFTRTLNAARDTGVGDLCLPNGRPDRPKTLDNFSRSYRWLVRRLDRLESSTLYDLPHFFPSQPAKCGATERQIGQLLCHVGLTVTSRYVHQDIEDLRHFVEEHTQRVRVAVGGVTSSLDEDSPAVRV